MCENLEGDPYTRLDPPGYTSGFNDDCTQLSSLKPHRAGRTCDEAAISQHSLTLNKISSCLIASIVPNEHPQKPKRKKENRSEHKGTLAKSCSRRVLPGDRTLEVFDE